MKKRFSQAVTIQFFLLALIVAASFALSFFSLTDGDQWGDFAGYFIQAKALLEGNPAKAVEQVGELNRLSATAPGPDAYPWGYPILVAAAAWRYGFDPLAIKLINPVFYALFLICLYLFAREKVRPGLALLVTALFAFSPISLSLNDHLRSDSVFLFFFTLALLLNEYARRKPNRVRYALLGGVILLASLFRTVGLTLLVLPLSAFFIQPKAPRRNAIQWAGFSLLIFFGGWLGYQLLLPNGEASYLSHLSLLNKKEFDLSLWIAFTTPKMIAASLPFEWAAYGLLLAAFGFGTLRLVRRDLEIFALLFGYLAVIILWPQPQGYRFFAPIMPLFVTYALAGTQNLPKAAWVGNLLISGLLLIIVAFDLPQTIGTAQATIQNERNISGPFDKYSSDVFEEINKRVGEGDRVHFDKPRSLLFFSERSSFRAGKCAHLGVGNYALFADQLAERATFSEEEFLGCEGIDPSLVYENQRFRLYKY